MHAYLKPQRKTFSKSTRLEAFDAGQTQCNNGAMQGNIKYGWMGPIRGSFELSSDAGCAGEGLSPCNIGIGIGKG